MARPCHPDGGGEAAKSGDGRLAKAAASVASGELGKFHKA